MSELKLDESKILYYQKKLHDWHNGIKITPITIDLALTQACNYNCNYCYAHRFQQRDGHKITFDIMKNFLNDAKELDVRGISLVADGESTVNPIWTDVIVYGKKIGIDMAIGSNGYLATKDKLEKVLPHLTYFRFNISAGLPPRYAKIHGVPEEYFYKVKNNIADAIKIKRKFNLSVSIGMQMVCMPEFKDDILPLAKLAIELEVDYLVIKHCSDDYNQGDSMNIDYGQYEKMNIVFDAAEDMTTEKTKIIVKRNKIKDGRNKSYQQCYGPPFHLQFSGSGLAIPCGCFTANRYKEYHIGDFTKQRFKNIINSDRYWEVMNVLSSKSFDANKICPTLCLQHNTNKILDNIKKTNVISPKPEKNIFHLSFI